MQTDPEPHDDASPRQVEEDALQSIAELIALDPGINEAGASQGGSTISIAIMVPYGTSENEVRQLCRGVLRIAMQICEDSEIGVSEFDYLIAAVTPDEETVALGAKAKNADRITY